MYEQAEQCECGSLNDRDTPKYDCPDCNGIGVRYYNAMRIQVQMVNKNTKAFIQQWGVQPDGTIGITISDRFRNLDTGELYMEFIPAPWDKMTCLKDRAKDMEVLTKGEVHRVSGVSKERARYLDLIDGTIRITQQGGIIYTEGTDYEIIDDIAGNHRQVNWIGTRPVDKARYSFSYITRPTWIILPDYPRHRRENNKMIMTNVMAKQVALVGQFSA